MLYIRTMEYHSAIKKNEIITFSATWMNPEFIVVSKINQREKDGYHMITLISET